VRDDEVEAATLLGGGGDELRPGQRFAKRYVIERLLGKGGMGMVWAVLDMELGERVALKTMRSSYSEVSEAVERFRREVRLARRITHPNVARIYDIGECSGVHYLTMELVEGGSVSDRRHHDGSWQLGRTLAVMQQVARGLGAAHASGVIHRDLKPANVLIDGTGRAVITDFGIARSASGDIRVTAESGALIGTPAYMSPEQVRGETLDARSDIYAFGVILFELITGVLPFPGDNAFLVAEARLHGPVPDPRDFAPVPGEIADLVMQCLARECNARPPSGEAIAAVLAALVAAHGGTLTELSTAAPTRPSRTAPTRAPAPRTASATMPTSSPGSTHAHKSVARVALLPFRFHGPPDDQYLAEALTDEIIDVLAGTRALRVAARSSVARFADARDPIAIGRELGVDAIVDGTVQRAGEIVRISARLLAADTGFQTWNERFEGRITDVFDLQDRMAKRIAESLRAGLVLTAQRGGACADATELYLRARRHLRAQDLGGFGPDGALCCVEQALELAPDFKPALALHAIVCERAWFNPESPPGVDWREKAKASIERALEHAPDLPETWVAAARVSSHEANYVDTARALTRALELAPTSAFAHESIGGLMCEAGRAEDGIRHLELAVELDPGAKLAFVSLARVHELHGRSDRADACLAAARGLMTRFEMAVVGSFARIAGWRRDFDAIRRVREEARSLPGVTPVFELMAAALLGEGEANTLEAQMAMITERAGPRFRTLGEQLAAEAFALREDVPRTMAAIQRAVDGTLVDIVWLDRCPGLELVRDLPEFTNARATVRARAEAIWNLD
jgi:eukaryotic-like serine/threonine-protein kinase